MEYVYLVYKSDAWNSNPELVDDVVYRTREQAVNRVVKEIIALKGETFANKDDAIAMVRDYDYNQTQGLETNFSIEKLKVR